MASFASEGGEGMSIGDTVYNKFYGIGVVKQIRNTGIGYEYFVKFERTSIWLSEDELKVAT